MKGRSLIIGIEGVDAVGKQTQSVLLEKWLEDAGFESILMSFPDYGTPIGKEIRAFLSTKRDFPPQVIHMLFAANRWERASTIREHQKEGKIVVVNRYTESNLVYGLANGLAVEWLAALEDGIPKTDLVLVLDAHPKLLNSRRADKDSYDKNETLQLKASVIYKELAPKFGWNLVDATRSVKEIHSSIKKIVKKRLTKEKAD